MNTPISILLTVFFLLPGFLTLKIRQLTSEYKELSMYEYTISSIGYSLILFVFWLFFNYSIKFFFYAEYDFFLKIETIVKTHDWSLLFSNFSLYLLFSYLCVFTCFSLFVFNIHWLKIWKKISRRLGLARFSDHLTPWEDFCILNKYNWISVELNDGRTIVGKIGLVSHLPFEKELVIQSVENSSIEIYDENKKKLDFGPTIAFTYVKFSEIKAIHASVDDSIEYEKISRRDYIENSLILFSSLLFIISFFVFLIISIGSQFMFCFLLLFGVLSIVSLYFNLKKLKRFC